MNIDWTSFSLEIINFLVLVWLLKHFLYKPVMDIIGRRQALIAEDLSKAEQARQAAAQMVTDFEARSKEMDSERLRAREGAERQLRENGAREVFGDRLVAGQGGQPVGFEVEIQLGVVFGLADGDQERRGAQRPFVEVVW